MVIRERKGISLKIALLIIDMQKVFLENQVEQRRIVGACEYINHVADLLRSKQHSVIHIKDIEGAEEIGSEMLNYVPELKVETNDLEVTKEHSNAFWKTELEATLLARETGLVIVAGFAAEHCVLSTYNGARERGFKAAVLQRGILSTYDDVINNTYRDRHMISYPVVEYIVNEN
jgi:nicotinamidase-related amidase